MKVSLSITGTEQVIGTLLAIDKGSDGMIDKIVKSNAREASRAAKADIKTPKDKGTLIQSINTRKVAQMRYSVGSNVTYAAYHEFGTGRYAKAYVPTLPRDVQDMAKRYKGKGVREVNLPARSFIFRALVRQMPTLLKDIQKYLKSFS